MFPFLNDLKTERVMSEDNDSPLIRRFKSPVRSNIQIRFPETGGHILGWMASALDPRFKKVTFLSDDNKVTI